MPSPAVRDRAWILALAAVVLVEAFWLRTGNLYHVHSAIRLNGTTLQGPTLLKVALTIGWLAVAASAGIVVGEVTPRLGADIFGAVEIGLLAAWLALWPLRSPWYGFPVSAGITQFAIALECTRLARGPFDLEGAPAAALGWLGGTAWLVYRLPLALISRVPPNLGIALTASRAAVQAAAFVAVVAAITLGYIGWTHLWPHAEEPPPVPAPDPGDRPRARTLPRAWGSVIPALVALALIGRAAPQIAASSWLTLPQALALVGHAAAVAAVGGVAGWLFAGVVWPSGAVPRQYRWVPVAVIAGWMLAANPFVIAHADQIMFRYMMHFRSARWVEALPACFAAAALGRLTWGLSLPRTLSLTLLTAWGAETLTAWYGSPHFALGPGSDISVPVTASLGFALSLGGIVAVLFLLFGRRRHMRQP